MIWVLSWVWCLVAGHRKETFTLHFPATHGGKFYQTHTFTRCARCGDLTDMESR